MNNQMKFILGVAVAIFGNNTFSATPHTKTPFSDPAAFHSQFQTNNFNRRMFKDDSGGAYFCDLVKAGGLDMDTCMPVKNQSKQLLHIQIHSEQFNPNLKESDIAPGGIFPAYDSDNTFKELRITVKNKVTETVIYDGKIHNWAGLVCGSKDCKKWE